MPRIFIALTTFAFLTFSQVAAAIGWEETILIVRTDAGGLVKLEYASGENEEAEGSRRYKTFSQNIGMKVTQCSYTDKDKFKKLRCTMLEGTRVNRIYEYRSRQSEPLKSISREIYLAYVGNRLPSSVGGLHDDMLVCTEGCPNGQMSVAIWLTCGECGMDEEFCSRRQEAQPKLANAAAEEVNLRAEPNAKSLVIGKLRLGQAIRLLQAQSACSEVETKDGVRVGRWIWVQTNMPQSLKGWVFDAYLRYEGEQ